MCFWGFLLSEYPSGYKGEDWDYNVLSEHICFTCIKNFKEKPWNICTISKRADLPFNLISKTMAGEFILDWGSDITLALDKKELSQNQNAPWSFVETYKKDIDWSSMALLSNPNFPLEYLRDSPESKGFNQKSWQYKNFYWVLGNKSLSLDFLEENVELLVQSKFGMLTLSGNNIITTDFILKHPTGLNGFSWDLYCLAQHLPLKFILENPLFSWVHMYNETKCHILQNICKSPSLTMDFLEAHIDLLEHFSVLNLCSNPVVTPEFIIKHFSRDFRLIPFLLPKLAKNKNVAMNFFKQYPDGIGGAKWDLRFVCQNKNLTWNFVEMNPDGFLGQQWSSKHLSHQRWEIDNAEMRFKHVKPVFP